MESQFMYLSDLNFNLDVWKRELKFQENEMEYFDEQLETIVMRNLEKDTLKTLERFQNKIIIERKEIRKLRHRIRLKKRELAQVNVVVEPVTNYHSKQLHLKDDMRTFHKLNYDFKEGIMDFFLKNL